MSLISMFRCAGAALVAGAVLSSSSAHAEDERPAVACAAAAQRAQVLRDAGKLLEARTSLRTCLNADCPTAIRKDCDTYLRDVELRVPSLVVRVRTQADEDLVPERIRIDDALLPVGLWTRAVDVDPGTHVLSVDLAGRPSIRRSVIVREGEHARVVNLTPPLEQLAPAPRPKSTRTTLIFSLIGVGAVGLGSFGYFAATGVQKWSGLNDTCRPSCAHDDVVDARSRLLVADASIALSVIALGATAYLFFTDPARGGAAPHARPVAAR